MEPTPIIGNANSDLEELKRLTLLSPSGFPDQRAANYAAWNGNIEVLEWLSSLSPPILPDNEAAKDAVEYGPANIVIWLAKRGIYPN